MLRPKSIIRVLETSPVCSGPLNAPAPIISDPFISLFCYYSSRGSFSYCEGSRPLDQPLHVPLVQRGGQVHLPVSAELPLRLAAPQAPWRPPVPGVRPQGSREQLWPSAQGEASCQGGEMSKLLDLLLSVLVFGWEFWQCIASICSSSSPSWRSIAPFFCWFLV